MPLSAARRRLVLCSLVVLLGAAPLAISEDPGSPTDAGLDFFVSEAVRPGLSVPVRDLPPASLAPFLVREINPRENPLEDEPDGGRRGTWDRTAIPLDPLIPGGVDGATRAPGLDFSWDATGNPAGCGGCSPPDVVGDVGLNHYVHMVNATKVAIYDKDGPTPLVAPFDLGSLWTSGSCAANDGDPVPIYDPIANRWVLSQFASPSHMCFAVSQTADPLGSYYTYEFNVGSFPDYFKLGVWPDGYYMSANEATYTAYAFDRTRMLAGLPATFQKFTGGANLYLPGDLDGPTPPPAGAPSYFYTFLDDSFHGGSDRIEVRAFDVDWATPANTTFSLVASIPVAPFTYTPCGFFNFTCIRQLGTTQRFDALGEWPMFRLPYRRFPTHETLVGAFGVGGGSGEVGAAIRWFELRKTGAAWTLHQQGTYDPGDGRDRVNASIAMDGSGNIALGYTVSSSTINPGIRYVTRNATDPLGTMGTEAVMQAGSGSQTGSNRWGDYAAMSVDPADDCRFYYTNEYYLTSSSSNWRTRVGAFTMPTCGCAVMPPAPANPAATATIPNRIDVGWDDSPVAGITRYFVSRATTSGGPYVLVATVADTSPGVGNGPRQAYPDSPVSGGTTYYYTVVADDAAGCTSPPSAEVSATATGPCLLPPTFGGLQSVQSAGTSVCTLNLAWSAATSNCGAALTYDVHRSTTTGFTPSPANRIATVGGTSHIDSAGLVHGTTYFYVVRAVDATSGSDGNTAERSASPGGPVTGPFTRTSSDVPKAIPDNAPAGTTSNLVVADTGPLADVDVNVSISHTWVGDILVVLRHPDGTAVALLDRPGVPGSQFGCNNDDMVVRFDGASSFNLENHCANTTPWYSGTGAPFQPLAALNGKPTNGTWQLVVSDNAGTDTGSLTAWSLVLSTGSSCTTAAAAPTEVSPSGNMTAAKGAGSSVNVVYTPACGATDDTIYRGTGSGPLPGLTWTQAHCAVGSDGTATFDPGTPAPGSFFYFVIVAQDGVQEGSYGRSSAGIERPEASGLACDFTRNLSGVCP